jgi:flavin-binding protein dodecin
MHDHVYKVVEIVGSSEVGIDDAIRTAVARASASLRHLRWFEVVETRGHIENGAVHHFQVTLKVGFTLDDPGQASSGGGMGGAEPGTDPLHEGP